MKRCRTRFRVAAALVAMVSVVSTSPAQPYEVADFARGFVLDSVATSVAVVPVPVDVYQTATRPDLGDLRVFNGAGEEVPHALYRPPRTAQPVPQRRPAFPLETSVDVSTSQWRVVLEEGGTVQLDSRRQVRRPAQLVGYLVDLGTSEEPIGAVQLHWADTTAAFTTTVTAETGRSLDSWQRWTQGTVAYLRTEDAVLRRDRIQGPLRAARYIRLTAERLPVLDSVRVVYRQDEPLPVDTLRVAGVRPEEHTVVFDLGGALPVETVRIDVPQPNTVVTAQLASATADDLEGDTAVDPADDGVWTVRHRGPFVRVQQGAQMLTTPPVPVGPTPARYWRLRVDPAGGGIGAGTVHLTASWHAAYLLFVARGSGPYTVAYGNYGALPASFEAETLLALLPEAGQQALQDLPLVRSSRFVVLGGAARLRPSEAPDWGQLGLWAVLALGTVLLVGMAWRLLQAPAEEVRSG